MKGPIGRVTKERKANGENPFNTTLKASMTVTEANYQELKQLLLGLSEGLPVSALYRFSISAIDIPTEALADKALDRMFAAADQERLQETEQPLSA